MQNLPANARWHVPKTNPPTVPKVYNGYHNDECTIPCSLCVTPTLSRVEFVTKYILYHQVFIFPLQKSPITSIASIAPQFPSKMPALANVNSIDAITSIELAFWPKKKTMPGHGIHTKCIVITGPIEKIFF